MRPLPRETGKEEKIKTRLIFILTAAGVVLFDQISKKWALQFLIGRESLAILPGIFHLTLVRNSGAAFGLFKGYTAVLVLVSGVFLFVSFLGRGRGVFTALPSWPWALVAGGAAGNLLDRLSYGHVVDFLDFRVWPVFNIADGAICIGVFTILVRSFKRGL